MVEEEEEGRDDGCAGIIDHGTPSLTDPLESTAANSSSQTHSHSHSDEADDSLAMDDDRENNLPSQDDGGRGIVVDPTGSASQHSGFPSQAEDGLEIAQSLYCNNSLDSVHANWNDIPCNENIPDSGELLLSGLTQKEEDEDAVPGIVANSNLGTGDYDSTIRNGHVNETATTGSNIDADSDATCTNDANSESDVALANSTSDGGAKSNNDQSVVEKAAGYDFDPSQNGSHDLLLNNADLDHIVMDQVQDDGDTDI